MRSTPHDAFPDAPTPRSRRARVTAAVALVAAPMALVAGLATGPAEAAPVDLATIDRGFTVITFGDATLDNVEIEGSLAIGGDVRFPRGYPIVHSTGESTRRLLLMGGGLLLAGVGALLARREFVR